ncbi:MAG: DUF1987 domain-containing protein [Bacteroides sp.]
MDTLHISATRYTPEIDFNPTTRHLQITGDSRPEDTVGFYQKVLLWIDNFIVAVKQEPRSEAQVLVTFRLNYFNSISAKYLLAIINKCKPLHADGNLLKIEWLYQEDDEESKQWGEDLQAITQLPFDIISYEEE